MKLAARILRRFVIALAILAIVVYLCDSASIRVNFPQRQPTSDLQIQPLISVPVKGGKTEYMLGDPQTETCSNSLFPQLGYRPCWYVKRQTEKRVRM